MDLHPQDRVVVSDHQLHGNMDVLSEGEVLSVADGVAEVVLDNEIVSRQFPVASVSKADSMYGGDLSGRPNEMPVVNALRR